MPIYEFVCEACGRLMEEMQKVSDPAPAKCSECGVKGRMCKIMSRSSFQLKGGGWYSDLYSSSSPKNAKSESSGKSESTKPEPAKAPKAEPAASAPSTPAKKESGS